MTPDPPRQPRRRKRLLAVALFALALVGVDRLVASFPRVWERYSPDDYRERIDRCADHRRDAVFVGGSPVAEGIDPDRIAGVGWHGTALTDPYAVGLSGGTTSDVYLATRHACPTSPRLLVYGITASDLNDSRHEPHAARTVFTWADVRDWQATRPDAAEWVTRNYFHGRLEEVSALYRYRHGVRMWAAKQPTAEWVPGCGPEQVAEAGRLLAHAGRLRTGTGYAPTEWFAHRRYDQMKEAGWVQPPFEYLARYRTGSHLKYLHRLIDWCGEGGCDLLLVDMPVTADLEARHPVEFSEYRERLREVERDRGVTVVRATRESTGLDDRHFADLIHLNEGGAAKFSDWLRAELERTGAAGARP